MAQLVARLVRNEKVGGSNPPSSTTGRHSIRMSAFCMPGRCCGACCCVALAPLVFRAPRVLCWAGLLGVPVGGGPPASRPRCEPSARRVVSKPGQALPPPTGTAAWPSGPSGALHTGGTWCTDGVRSPARPCHRPRAPQPGPPYTGVLHAGGACGAVRAGTRLEARPCPPDPPVPSTPVVPGR